jgi:hypothetical protein
VSFIAIVGEVHTSLLQTSAALSPDMTAKLVDLQPGERVRFRSRPVRLAWSAGLLTGVDCAAPLPAAARRGRLVGTLLSSVSVTEGQLLQVATKTLIRRSDVDRRQSWSHYLAAPGTVELLGPAPREAVAAGFLDPSRTGNALDIAALNGHVLARVQKSALLDQRAPFKARRTRMRWVARTSGSERQHADFTIDADGFRTLSIEVPDRLTSVVSELCSDLALHDWLLTTLQDAVDRALTGAVSWQRALGGLRPVIENLAHTWMPGARVDEGLSALWVELERQARLTTQWATAVTRVRDFIQIRLAEGLLAAPLPAIAESATTSGLQER